jgi:histidine phosphotransferase ChpT
LSIATSADARDAPDLSDLGALLGSRICHDLISPLGAIGNGVELIALSGAEPTPEMALIAESVESANARIRFFRVAFGSAGEEQTVGAQEISAIFEALDRSGRHRIDWRAGGGVRREVKLAFLIVLCIESALPWGGRITAERDGTLWRITGRADRFKLEQRLWDALADGTAPLEVSSAEVEFPLARVEAARLSRRLQVDSGAEGITVSF